MARTLDTALLEQVTAQYLMGRPTLRIERELAAEHKCPPRRIRAYLKRAREKLAAQFAGVPIDAVKARSEAMILEAIATASKAGDATAVFNGAMRLVEIAGGLKRVLDVNAQVGGLGEAFGQWNREQQPKREAGAVG